MEKACVPRENVKGIGIAGQMHGLVMLDADGNVLRRPILWCDQRSHSQVDEMLALMPYEKWMDITANPPIAAWTAAKYLWIRQHQPKLLLSVLGISESMLGKLYESQEITGYLRPEIAAYCGLTTQTAVVGGAADNAGAAIGTGVVENGDAFTSIGTSALIYTQVDQYRPVPDGSLHLCCSAVPGTWFTMGGPQAASLSFEWFKNNFCKGMINKFKSRIIIWSSGFIYSGIIKRFSIIRVKTELSYVGYFK